MKIERLEVALAHVQKHEFVPADDREPLRHQGTAVLAGPVKLDEVDEVEAGVDPVAGLLVAPGVLVVQGHPQPTLDGFTQPLVVGRADAPAQNLHELVGREFHGWAAEALPAAEL